MIVVGLEIASKMKLNRDEKRQRMKGGRMIRELVATQVGAFAESLSRVLESRSLNTDSTAFDVQVYTVAYRVYKGTFIIARVHVRRATPTVRGVEESENDGQRGKREKRWIVAKERTRENRRKGTKGVHRGCCVGNE